MRIIDLHFTGDNMSPSSFIFFSWAL